MPTPPATMDRGRKITMATNVKPATGRDVRKSTRDVRLSIVFSEDTLDALAAWARAEGRSTPAQGRFLIEQAVMARRDRLALTRR
jgi:hypothetical protein